MPIVYIFVLFFLSSCSLTRLVDLPVSSELEKRVQARIQYVERETGLRCLRPCKLRVVRAHFIDGSGHPVAFSPRQVASAGWIDWSTRRSRGEFWKKWGKTEASVAADDPAQIVFPVVEGYSVGDEVISHEALHAVLLSNGIAGHPSNFAHLAWRWRGD